MSAEEWKIDEYGFVTNGKVFFHIARVNFLSKVWVLNKAEEKQYCIDIGFTGGVRSISWPEEESRDSIYNWLTKALVEKGKQEREHSAIKHNMQSAGLEIQNRLAGAIFK